jgi:hypothetical protein
VVSDVWARLRQLKSYGAAKREILPGVEYRQSRYLNNCCENSHRPTRQREYRMQGEYRKNKATFHASPPPAPPRTSPVSSLGVLASRPSTPSAGEFGRPPGRPYVVGILVARFEARHMQ